MHPKKGSVDNKPSVVGFVPRIPGAVGWGLIKDSKRSLMTDKL